jgi:Nucleotidyl transferase AbiEii toxin, Type IV TA system
VNPEPRQRDDYSPRQIEAARRVLVDLGQVLAMFEDCLVVIGGWVPDLLLEQADEPHIGSIDVDLALDAKKLGDGRYADMLKLLLNTGRYKPGAKPFQLVVEVDLKDGDKAIEVEVEFLASKDVKLKKNRPKLLENFRVLQADACGTAFHAPVKMEIIGKTVRGANNTVRLRVASLPDFLVMKAHALAGRDKPKDAYDLCYCLEYLPDGMAALAAGWKNRRKEKDVTRAIEILREKFASVDAFGPGQIIEFHGSVDTETQAMQARRAFEVMQQFLSYL